MSSMLFPELKYIFIDLDDLHSDYLNANWTTWKQTATIFYEVKRQTFGV